MTAAAMLLQRGPTNTVTAATITPVNFDVQLICRAVENMQPTCHMRPVSDNVFAPLERAVCANLAATQLPWKVLVLRMIPCQAAVNDTHNRAAL